MMTMTSCLVQSLGEIICIYDWNFKVVFVEGIFCKSGKLVVDQWKVAFHADKDQISSYC